MTEEEILKKKLDMLNKNSHYGVTDVIDVNDIFYYYGMIMNVDPSEIEKIVNNYIESYQKEEIKMKKATSVQEIKNVKDIIFSIENNIAVMESKLTIVAATDDDIFEFVFEGPDILQNCKRLGLFTGWEKDQTIRKLEKDNKELNEEVKKLERNAKLNKESADTWSKAYYDLSIKFEKMQNENEKLKKELHSLKEESKKKLHWKIAELEELQTPSIPSKMIDRVNELEKLNKEMIALNDDLEQEFDDEVEKNNKLHAEVKRLREKYECGKDNKPLTRADILRTAEKCVCGQREQDYGTPESNFKLIADLWNGYLGFTSYVLELEEYLMELKDKGIDIDINVPEPKAIFPEDVAMMMALLKIARIKNGGGSGDSFVDLAGYAACGGEIWAEEKKQKDQN